MKRRHRGEINIFFRYFGDSSSVFSPVFFLFRLGGVRVRVQRGMGELSDKGEVMIFRDP